MHNSRNNTKGFAIHFAMGCTCLC